jgi:thiosulfate/3-mercaptopyruvate sulfurtransferase
MSLPLIVEPTELAGHLNDDDLQIIDLCRPEVYAKIHLPGAIHITPSELVSGVAPATGKLPGTDRLRSLFERIGYDPTKQIVAYDDEGGGWAGRFIWTLDIIGHERSSYLNGGLVAWMGEGLPTTTVQPQTKPAKDLEFEIDLSPQVSMADTLSSIDDPQTIVWDARSAEEYRGQKLAAARGGHIPGAINLDWLDTMDRDNGLRIRKDIETQLEQLGITRDKRVITHCQTHHRSGLTYIIGKSLGYDIRAYDGSWSEWGNQPDTPIET